MKKREIVALFMIVMLAIPGVALAGALPDTGQETCYDDEGTPAKNCPEICDDPVNGCVRTFVDPNDSTKTINKYYYQDGETYVEYYYYGFRKCYDDDGTSGACEAIKCFGKSGVSDPKDCPTKCYRDSKGLDTSVVACPSISTDRGSGTDDFYGQDANYTINPPSYTKLGQNGVIVDADWKMVKDNSTGLVWLLKESGAASFDNPNVAGNMYPISDPGVNTTARFIELINTLGKGGYKDWRLPTIKELASIANCGMSGPAIDTDNFINMEAGQYWSSTAATGADLTGQTFYVDFDDGSVGSDAQTVAKYVIAVRRPDTSSASGGVIADGDVITNTNTGLMWRKTHTLLDDWEGAMLSCEALDFGGYDDWRLPSRKELESIIDYTKYDPAVGSDFIVEKLYYWTSTTYAKEPLNAWVVNLKNGYVESKGKTEDHYVLAVRGGQNQESGVIISEPAQTSSWMAGRVMPIIWDGSAIKGNVTISISSDAGKTFVPIVSNTANDGSYVWWNIGKADNGEDLGLSLDDEAYNYMLKIDPADGSVTGENTQGFFSMGPDTGSAGGVAGDVDGNGVVDLVDVIMNLQNMVK